MFHGCSYLEGRARSTSSSLIMGHEGVGRVVALGPNASRLKIGDRVGIGYVHSACGHCRDCLTGGENYCPDFDATGYSIQGCFAEYVCLRDQWANKIPNGITPVEAAPLMCAGAASVSYTHLTLPTNRCV